jgi:hypothetical protein
LLKKLYLYIVYKMSLVRTNKQAYAILSDISGNAVTVSGSSLKVAVTDSLPTGTNSLGSINGVVPGTGVTQLGTVQGGDVSTTNVGVAGLAISDNALDGVVDGSYTTLRTDGSGAMWVHLAPGTSAIGTVTGTVTVGNTVTVTGSVTTNGSTGAVTVFARNYVDGVVYDGSFTSQDDVTYDLSGGSQFSFAGRAQSGGADVSFVLAMYACSGSAHGTPDTAAVAGDMLDTGYVLQNLGAGGPFFATFNDIGFPYVAFKNVTTEVTGNAADICLNLYIYRR